MINNSLSVKSERIELINVLRFFAAVSVMMYHYTFMFFYRGNSYIDFPLLRYIFHYGYLGVDLFFIISGFVIAMTAKGRSWKEFAISRAVRLYPAMWFSVSVTAIFFFVAHWYRLGENLVSISTYLANMSMVPSLFHERMVDGSYWSLMVEIKFYFLIFLLILCGLYRYFEYITIAFSFALFIATFIMHLPGNNASYFAAGILFYAIYEKGLSLVRALSICLLCLVSTYYASSRSVELSQGYHTVFSGLTISLFIVSFYVLFTLISLKKIYLKKRYVYGVLGAVTYPIYLVHQEAGRIFFKFTEHVFNLSSCVALSMQILLVMLFATVVALYFEKKVQVRLKTFLTYLANKV